MDADQHEQSLDELPEVALLEVLKLLPIEDLLTCRLVCKRLGELAMHPTVWQEKSLLDWGENHQKLACPVLRLAPCLGRVEDLRSRDVCVHTLSTTRCAVEHLGIDANVKLSASAVLEVALALQRQEVLGRLRSLWITLRPKDTTKGHESILYTTLALTSRLLETLVVEVMPEAGATPGTECFFEGIQVPSSLKSVKFYLHRQETALVDFLLSTHAATLETVRFHGPASTSTLQLLAGLPRLRELTCRLQAGLEVLAASESLQVLFIRVKGRVEEPAEVVAGAASFLRQARQLRQVSLQCDDSGAHSSQFPAALVKALARGAARSHLEKLCVVCRCDGQQHLERALLDALPELPALRELDLDCWRYRQPQDESHRHEPLDESDESYEQLLRGLTPATAPAALECLTVGACAHAWTHRPSVKALLAANPSLRVRVSWRHFISYDTGFDDVKPTSTCGYCYACKLNCHPELREARNNSHVCFSLKQELSICPTVHNNSTVSL